MSNSAELQDQHLSFYNTIRQCCFGNFSIRFWEKTVNFQLGMGPFTGPACKGYYALGIHHCHQSGDCSEVMFGFPEFALPT